MELYTDDMPTRRIGKAGGYSSGSTVLWSTKTSHGKNSMLLWWLVMHGARVGTEKKVIAIMRLLSSYGNVVHLGQKRS